MTRRINHNMDERAELLRREAELRERERRELAEAEAQRLRVYADFEEERRRGRATNEEQNQTAINYGTDNKDRPPVYAPQPLYPTLPAEDTPLFSTSNRNTGEPRSSKRPGFWKAFSAVIPYILPCTIFTSFVILFLVYLCNLPAAHRPIPQPNTPAPPPPPPPVPYERRIAIIGSPPPPPLPSLLRINNPRCRPRRRLRRLPPLSPRLPLARPTPHLFVREILTHRWALRATCNNCPWRIPRSRRNHVFKNLLSPLQSRRLSRSQPHLLR